MAHCDRQRLDSQGRERGATRPIGRLPAIPYQLGFTAEPYSSTLQSRLPGEPGSPWNAAQALRRIAANTGGAVEEEILMEVAK